MKFLFSTILLLAAVSAESAPKWVEDSFTNINSEDEKIKRKAAFNLSDYYTSNGVENINSEDRDLLNKNVDNLIEYMLDPAIAVSITELLVTRKMPADDNFKSYVEYLDESRKSKIEGALQKNLHSNVLLVAEESAKGLIAMADCKYRDEIINRKKMTTELGESEYSFEYVLKILNKKCPPNP